MHFRTLLRLAIAVTAAVLVIAMVRGRSTNFAAQSLTLPTQPITRELPGLDEPNPLIEGMQAFARGDMARAVQLLSTTSAVALDDWRLFVLAESAHSLADSETAQAALDELIADYPGSPIWGLAIARATQMAAELEQWDIALQWADLARDRPLSAATASGVEVVVWEMGATLGRPELQEQAGRILLVVDPALADELRVEATLTKALGALDLTELLTPIQLQQRAQKLIEGRLPEQALSTLDLVPEGQRTFDWKLLRAEALTRDHRGREALQVLSGLDSSDLDRRMAVRWQRATAARDASKVRRGRSNLSSSQREEMGRLAKQQLREVANLTPDRQLRSRSLKLLFVEISEEEDSFEPAFAVLEQLHRLDAGDTTGTRYLWRLGWQAYTRRNYPVAIGYWSELESLYPGTNSARSGRYWTGRTHEVMGHTARATSIYREIVGAQADDFYSRHARARLEEASVPPAGSPHRPTEPWPTDPVLARARWLSDLGLNEFAMHELEAYADTVDRRAYCAEKAVFLARNDQRRDSIGSLVCAFPSLGRTSQSALPKEALELYYPLDFRGIIEKRSVEQGLSPFIVFAMVRQESAFDSSARSWAGARGLMQLMPATGKEIAQRLGLSYSTSRLEDPDFSVRLGTRYFRQVLDMFDGNEELALAGYNGGPYRIKKLWRQAGSDAELDHFVEGLSLEETKMYVKRILLFEDSYKKLYSAGS